MKFHCSVKFVPLSCWHTRDQRLMDIRNLINYHSFEQWQTFEKHINLYIFFTHNIRNCLNVFLLNFVNFICFIDVHVLYIASRYNLRVFFFFLFCVGESSIADVPVHAGDQVSNNVVTVRVRIFDIYGDYGTFMKKLKIKVNIMIFEFIYLYFFHIINMYYLHL